MPHGFIIPKTTKNQSSPSVVEHFTVEELFEAKGRQFKGESSNDIIRDLMKRHQLPLPPEKKKGPSKKGDPGFLGQKMNGIYRRLTQIAEDDQEQFKLLAQKHGFPQGEDPIPTAKTPKKAKPPATEEKEIQTIQKSLEPDDTQATTSDEIDQMLGEMETVEEVENAQ